MRSGPELTFSSCIGGVFVWDKCCPGNGGGRSGPHRNMLCGCEVSSMTSYVLWVHLETQVVMFVRSEIPEQTIKEAGLSGARTNDFKARRIAPSCHLETRLGINRSTLILSPHGSYHRAIGSIHRVLIESLNTANGNLWCTTWSGWWRRFKGYIESLDPDNSNIQCLTPSAVDNCLPWLMP